MAEGGETSGGGLGPDPPAGGAPPEGSFRRGEADLLAERRARRSAGSGEQVLERRADAAEATVRTLEAHVASLTRPGEPAGGREHAAPAAPLAAGEPEPRGEQPPPGAIVEHELRRLKQSEYAEQRQRAEAEARIAAVERESGADVERLRRRLSDSENEAGMLAGRLEQLRRELAEAEQRLGAQRAAMQLAEAELQGRIAELERRSLAAERELASERAAREHAERSLELVRVGHRRLEALVRELADAGVRLRAAAAMAPQSQPAPPGAGPSLAGEPALVGERQQAAAGSEQVAAPAGEAGSPPLRGPGDGARGGAAVGARPGASPRNGEMVDALAAAVERLRARVAESAPAASRPQPPRQRHKHSLSLIARIRLARKQRRQR